MNKQHRQSTKEQNKLNSWSCEFRKCFCRCLNSLAMKKIACYLTSTLGIIVAVQSIYFAQQGCDKFLCYAWFVIGMTFTILFIITGNEK